MVWHPRRWRGVDGASLGMPRARARPWGRWCRSSGSCCDPGPGGVGAGGVVCEEALPACGEWDGPMLVMDVVVAGNIGDHGGLFSVTWSQLKRILPEINIIVSIEWARPV